MRLPGVLNQQNLEQQVQVGPQLVGVGVRHLHTCNLQASFQRILDVPQVWKQAGHTVDSYLPEQLAEHGGGELGVLPAAEAEQLHRLLRVAAVLDDLLHIAGPHKQDLCHQLLHGHHRCREVGVAVRVRERRVSWSGQTLESILLCIHATGLCFRVPPLGSDV